MSLNAILEFLNCVLGTHEKTDIGGNKIPRYYDEGPNFFDIPRLRRVLPELLYDFQGAREFPEDKDRKAAANIRIPLQSEVGCSSSEIKIIERDVASMISNIYSNFTSISFR